MRAYLSGSIEYSPDLGKGWRAQVTPFLRALGHDVYDPAADEKKNLTDEEVREFRGWKTADLVRYQATVRKIIDFERGRAASVQLNVAETDARTNPNDHSDHLMTAKAALDAIKDLICVRRVYYVDYASSHLPENLTARERDMESSVFAVTLAGVLAFDHRTAWHHYDESFVGRNYFRVEEGSGRCGGTATEMAVARH